MVQILTHTHISNKKGWFKLLIYSDDTATLMEAEGFNIIVDTIINEDGSQRNIFRLIGYGIGFNLVLGNYPTEAIARKILQELASLILKNEKTCDLKTIENKIMKGQE